MCGPFDSGSSHLPSTQVSAPCFNSYDFQHDAKSEACACSLEDTECEFGYELRGQECVKVSDVELNNCPVSLQIDS